MWSCWKITWKYYPRAHFTCVEMSVDIQSLFKKVESRTYVIMYPNVLDLISYFLVENFDLFLCKRSPFRIMLQRAPSIGEIATQSFGLVNFLLCCSFHRTAFPFPRRWCHRSSCCTAACSSVCKTLLMLPGCCFASLCSAKIVFAPTLLLPNPISPKTGARQAKPKELGNAARLTGLTSRT